MRENLFELFLFLVFVSWWYDIFQRYVHLLCFCPYNDQPRDRSFACSRPTTDTHNLFVFHRVGTWHNPPCAATAAAAALTRSFPPSQLTRLGSEPRSTGEDVCSQQLKRPPHSSPRSPHGRSLKPRNTRSDLASPQPPSQGGLNSVARCVNTEHKHTTRVRVMFPVRWGL